MIITNRPCMLFPRKVPGDGDFEVDEELCTACQQCMKLGCPSLRHAEATVKDRRKVEIDARDLHGLLALRATLQGGRDRQGG